MEAIIPTKIWMPTLGTKVPGTVNTKVISNDLDMVDKFREAVAILIASYQ